MNNKVLKKRLVLKKKVKIFITKFMLATICLLIALIAVKKNPELKGVIQSKVYEESIAFTKVKDFYNKYFSSYKSLNNLFTEEQPVFSEKISYKKEEKYQNGVKLTVEDNYLVPAVKEGIVVFIGEKDGLGKTIIIEQTDGVDVFYGNLKEINVNIYDYIEKGTLIGQVEKNNLYLEFQKEGNVIDYKKYL